MKTKKKQKRNQISGWIWLLAGFAVFLAVVDVAAVLYLSYGRHTVEPEQQTETAVSREVHVCGHIYDAEAEEISIDSLTEADIPIFTQFHNLSRIDATQIRNYGLIQELARKLPECIILWSVELGGKRWEPSAEILDLSDTGVTVNDMMSELAWFSNLKQVDILDGNFPEEQKRQLMEAYPDVVFQWPVDAAGKIRMSTETQLSYAGEMVDVATLASAGELFYGVLDLDLSGCGCTTEELLILQEAYPEAVIHSEISAFGVDFTTDSQTLDFSGIPMANPSEIEKIMPLMHQLTNVDMCDCGISNEEMHALNQRYEEVQFVWKVYFSVYSLRTDATYFCASDLPWNGYVAIKMDDAQLEPIKYCTELVALDLGHMRYTDLSFLENMPKLEYLILVEAQYKDITPIGTLKNLKYLELFVNTIDDLTPLLNCPELRHLNIGYTSGFDTSVLKEMKNLERLWYPGNRMSDEEIRELTDALPDTICHLPAGDPDGSTGAGWREADIYFEMRNMFSMHYMPGGTGMDPKK